MKVKRVKSKTQLDELALKSGATVKTKTGQQFNSNKTKAEVRPRLEPATKPEPAPLPAEPAKETIIKHDSAAINELSETITDIGKANVMMLAELKQQISEIKFTAAEPPSEWVFDVVRDDKGYITRIKATAATEKRTIN